MRDTAVLQTSASTRPQLIRTVTYDRHLNENKPYFRKFLDVLDKKIATQRAMPPKKKSAVR
jgi:hypothetical protein